MGRKTSWLKDGYLFFKENGEKIEAQYMNFDDSAWEKVYVPHDWAIGKDFDPTLDPKMVHMTFENNVYEAIGCGDTGALPTVGRGWYRRSLDIGEEAAGRRIFLEFDGIMWKSEIYVNGKLAAKNHFGYKSFEVEITELVEPGKKNLLAVLAEVEPDCSRWYSGAGIFRDVRLVIKEKTHIKYNGIYAKTPVVSDDFAKLEVQTEFEGNPEKIENILIAPDGELLGEVAELTEPVLWSPEKPALYTLVTRLYDGGEIADEVETKIGFRYFSFDANEGFKFNGKKAVFKGVCNHHDLGILGAAAERSAIRRQLEILKGMGCNAIRTSHNPPSPELLSLCDELGLFVMDEFFDEWILPKVKNGYAKYFGQHAEEDAVSIIHRDRNHPSVIIWSIGNEIPEQGEDKYKYVAQFLYNIVKREDASRPVTAAFNWADADEHGMPDVVDIVGMNYKPHLYAPWHEAHPNYILYGSETASCVSTRGEFLLPMEVDHPAKQNADNTVSSYDLSSPAWAQHPDLEFEGQDDNPFVMGEFVWTGFDYIGEPTPYNDKWPARSSYFGIIDLCGVPKSRYYLYKSRWSGEDVLHIMPHWNWEGHEGEEIPVQLYTSFDEAELFLNGKSLGKRKKSLDGEFGRYRIIWKVPFEAGELKAVAYDKDGNAKLEASVETAGTAKKLKLFCDGEDFYQELAGNKSYRVKNGDVLFVHAAILDEKDRLCPKAAETVSLLSNEGFEYIGSSNGDPRELDGFAKKDRKTLNGICTYAFRAKAVGTGVIKAKFASCECELAVEIG